jgi:hypothetical protein
VIFYFLELVVMKNILLKCINGLRPVDVAFALLIFTLVFRQRLDSRLRLKDGNGIIGYAVQQHCQFCRFGRSLGIPFLSILDHSK